MFPRLMIGFVTCVALLNPAVLLGGDPPSRRGELPDDRTIDSVEWSRWEILVDGKQGWRLGPRSSLSVTLKGEVHFTYESKPDTGSGGHVVQKQWAIPQGEARELLGGLVGDGLLRIESDDPRGVSGCSVRAYYGRWQMETRSTSMPKPVMDRLLPLLRRAHPDIWGKIP